MPIWSWRQLKHCWCSVWCLVQAVEKSGSLSHSFRSHSAPRSTVLSIAMFGEVVEMADSLINNSINFKFGVTLITGREGSWKQNLPSGQIDDFIPICRLPPINLRRFFDKPQMFSVNQIILYTVFSWCKWWPDTWVEKGACGGCTDGGGKGLCAVCNSTWLTWLVFL